MKKYLDTRIKDVLKEYPALAGVLEEFDINCYRCKGHCFLKDIFEEHNLSMEQEMDLKNKVLAIIPE